MVTKQTFYTTCMLQFGTPSPPPGIVATVGGSMPVSQAQAQVQAQTHSHTQSQAQSHIQQLAGQSQSGGPVPSNLHQTNRPLVSVPHRNVANGISPGTALGLSATG